MLPALGAAGRAALAATMRKRPLLAFDFDGTLAPIVARPDDARLTRAVASRTGLIGLLGCRSDRTVRRGSV